MRVVWKLSNLVQTSFELQFSKTSLLLYTTSNELWILRNFVTMQVRIESLKIAYIIFISLWILAYLWVRVVKLLIHIIKDSEKPPFPTNHINPFHSVKRESHRKQVLSPSHQCQALVRKLLGFDLHLTTWPSSDLPLTLI